MSRLPTRRPALSRHRSFAELADYAVRILDIAPVDGVITDGSRVRAAPAGYLADGTAGDNKGPDQDRPEVGVEGSTQ